ncbi:MAG: MMPL family transporter [Methylacidiphilales bacterium]|nr:MMPL family transporter [Candidatus Methylacidiphilales bacterium]MDW8348902.1 MMPL family transporter [Verrucomicrobiae bacterium]
MHHIHRWIKRLLQGLAPQIYRYHGWILVFAVILTASAGWLVATRLKVTNSTNVLIREDSPSHKNYLAFKKEFGVEEDFVIVIQSENVERNREVARVIGERLEQLDEHVGRVLYRIDFSSLQNRFLLFLPHEDLVKLEEEVKQFARVLRQPGFRLDINSILNEANAKFSEKYLRRASNWREFKPFVARFIEMLDQLASHLQNPITNNARFPSSARASEVKQKMQGVQRLMEENEYLSYDEGRIVLVLASPVNVDMFAASPYGAATAAIRKVIEEVQRAYQDVRIGLTGEPVLMDDELRISMDDSAKAAVLSFGICALLFILAYRQVNRPLCALVVLVMGIVWSLAFAVLAIGHLNIISQAFVAMVIGLGIDFGIQMMSRYEEELARCKNILTALTQTLGHTGVVLVTGASTTAAAFYTMCFNDFIGLAEFGLIAGTGVLLCLIGNLFVLPSLYVFFDLRKSQDQLSRSADPSHWTPGVLMQKVLFFSPRLVLVGTGVALLVAGLVMHRVYFDYNLLNLQSQSLESVRLTHKLLDVAGNSIIYGIVIAEDKEDAKRKTEALKALPTVQEVRSILDFFPERQEEKLPIIRRIVELLRGIRLDTDVSRSIDVERTRKRLQELLEHSREGRREASKYRAVSQMARDAEEVFGRLIPPIERALAAMGDLSQEEIGRRLNRYQVEVFGTMQKDLAFLKQQAFDRVIMLEDVPGVIRQRFVSSRGRLLIEAHPKENIWDREPNVRFVNDLRSVDPMATGTPVQNYEYIELLRQSYLEAAQWALLTVVVLIFLHFGRITHGLLALLPLGIAIVFTLGLMVALQIPFNPANIVTLPLVIGIGVAYGIYTVDRWREAPQMNLFSNSTGKAVVMSALTSMVGFGSMMISQYEGLYSLGLLMMVGIGMCLIASTMILPQVLYCINICMSRGEKEA